MTAEAVVDALTRAGVRPPGLGPVLVVDDDEPSARLMTASLERAGFRAVIALDGELALAAAARERPSAVVLDLIMPNLDGIALLDRVRRDPSWEGVPIFIWSVKELSRADHDALLERASAVFTKDGESAGALVEIIARHVGVHRASSDRDDR
ncbi:MAG: response regulator [Polyangiaceae bacterium]